MIGIINIYKKTNMSSHTVVAKIKHLLNIKRVGHLGTLDPMAEGVLPVCIGKATRLFDYFLSKTKTYEAEFDFSFLTDTLDREGEVLKSNLNVPSIDKIYLALPNFVGSIEQLPPKYSAKKVNGVRAYKLARKDQEFNLNTKSVMINKFECLGQINKTTYKFLIDCSAGTYIRSLGRDLANYLDTEATMTKLVRTRVGNFYLKDALAVDELYFDKIVNNIIKLENLNLAFKEINVDEENFKKILNGVSIKVDSDDTFVIKYEGKIIGIGKSKNGDLKIDTNLREDYD